MFTVNARERHAIQPCPSILIAPRLKLETPARAIMSVADKKAFHTTISHHFAVLMVGLRLPIETTLLPAALMDLTYLIQSRVALRQPVLAKPVIVRFSGGDEDSIFSITQMRSSSLMLPAS